MKYHTRTSKALNAYEYADFLATVSIALECGYHYDNDLVVRRVCRKMAKRFTSPEIKQVMRYMANKKEPYKYLLGRFEEIEAEYPLMEFIRVGYMYAPK